MSQVPAGPFEVSSFVWLWLVASMVAMASQRFRLPYAPSLVVAGLFIGMLAWVPHPRLDPHTLFTLFLPPLLFETAIQLKAEELRADAWPIGLLAIAGTLASTLFVGVLASWWLPLPLVTALIFGALISPTDPIAVVTVLKRLKVNHRLMLLIESESLFNDGVAVVLFTVILGAASQGTLSPVGILGSFVAVVAGGTAVGGAIGWLASRATRWFDDHLVELMLTTITAFGSYMVAEALHVSGVIAVVAAGVVVGNDGMRKGMRASTRAAVAAFWEYAAFAVNAIVFLLIGLEAARERWWSHLPAVVIGIGIVLVARALSVYLLAALANLRRGSLPWAWQHLMVWGGLRGALCMALALGLPENFPQRELLLSLTFGYVLFSLLVQAPTAGPFIGRLGLREPPPAAEAP